jgi:hypothetical protein
MDQVLVLNTYVVFLLFYCFFEGIAKHFIVSEYYCKLNMIDACRRSTSIKQIACRNRS